MRLRTGLLAGGACALGLLVAAAPGRAQAPLNEPAAHEPAGRALFEIEPYVVHTGPAEALLAWRLSAEAGSSVEFGQTLDYELGRVESPAGRQHRALLTGLPPGALIHYRVERAFQGSFRVERPEPGFRFAVIGHTHGTELFGHYPDALLVARLAELDLDFVLHAGDATFYATVEDFERFFFRPFRSLISGIPVYLSPGNHDAGWPFVDGINLAPFKELFPYPYPEDIVEGEKQACYAIEKGGVQFLFLSYVSPMGDRSYQRRWLHRHLVKSEHDFNVIVYGGGNPYFEEAGFLQWLSNYPVDCVLNGDSVRRKETWRIERGLLIGFAGTGATDPHPLIYGEASPEVLVMRTMDSAGGAGETRWIHSRREHPPLQQLAVGEVDFLPDRKVGFVSLELAETVPSEQLRGVQLRLEVAEDVQRALFVHAVPTTQEGKGPGYESLKYRVRTGDELVSLPLRSLRPNGGPYVLEHLRVSLLGVAGPGEVEILEAWLY